MNQDQVAVTAGDQRDLQNLKIYRLSVSNWVKIRDLPHEVGAGRLNSQFRQ